MGRKSRADLQAERESVQAKIVANQAKIVAKTAGVPKGFDSKADKFAGITSVMRANEKSKSPGHPSVSSVYKKNLNNLINSERTRGTAMNISGMNASAAALNKGNAVNLVDETPNFTDMGMDMGNMSWTAKPNSLQQTNIDRIKPVDAEKAANDNQETSWFDIGRKLTAESIESQNKSKVASGKNEAKIAQEIAFEKAKEKGAANAAELMAEMKADMAEMKADTDRAMGSGIGDSSGNIIRPGYQDDFYQKQLASEAYARKEAAKAAELLAAEKAEIEAYKASQGTIDTDATIGLVTIEDTENLEATATDTAIKSMDSVHNQLKADLEQAVNEENLYATATTEAQKSLSEEQKADNERLKFKEKLEKGETSTSNLGQTQNERLEDKKAQENLKSNANTTPLGQSFGLKEERARTQAKSEEKERMTAVMNKLDEEKNAKDVGLEGYVNNGTVSKADQAIFDKAKAQREKERKQLTSGMDGIDEGIAQHQSYMYGEGIDSDLREGYVPHSQLGDGLDYLNDPRFAGRPSTNINRYEKPIKKPVGGIQRFIASMNKSSGFARPNKYEVVFHLPEMLMGKYDTRQLTMHCDTIGWPGHDLQTQSVKKASEPAKHYVQSHAFAGTISATFYLDVEHSERFLFEQWQELAVNRYTHKANYYKDYIGSMEMYQLSSELNKIDFANNKRFSKRGDLIGDINNSVEGEGIRTYGIKVFDVFPETISATEYAYIQAETVQLLTVEFNYREHLPIPITENNQRPIV